MGIIYKITNTVNNKSYIGQTQLSLEKRYNEHFRDSNRRDYKFSRAIRKYGKEAFSVEILEEVPAEKLNEREMFWIDTFDTYHNGYNSTKGGEGLLKVDQHQIEQLWDKGLSIADIASVLEYCKYTIINHLITYPNYSEKESIRRGKKNQMRSINQFDLNGNYITSYNSINDAARSLNIDRTMISMCCRKKRCSAGGFQWRYSDDNSPQKYNSENKKMRPVRQYDLTGLFVAEFDSISKAEKATGINYSGISACCNNRRKSAGGYKWIYSDDSEVKNHAF